MINAIPYLVGLLAMILWTRRAADPTVRVAVPALVGGLAIPVALYLSNPWLAMVAVTICACGVLSALPGFWSLPTAYLTGAAAAAGIGLINSLGNLSGFRRAVRHRAALRRHRQQPARAVGRRDLHALGGRGHLGAAPVAPT